MGTPCKPYEGYVAPTGYGYRTFQRVPTPAHRAAYIEAYGPPPEGWQVDHLCHDPETCDGGSACPHRACVELTHLEAVPQRINLLRGGSPAGRNSRKTHCKNDHPFGPESVRSDGRGRRCRICERTAQARRNRVKKEAGRLGH